LGFNRFERQWFERFWQNNAAGRFGVASLVPARSYQHFAAMTKRLRGVVGISGQMPADRTIRQWALGAMTVSALALGGCSTQIADMPAIGLPADAPERPKEAGGYLPVHDLPPERHEEVIKPAELAKIQSELTAARDRQAVATSPAKPVKKHSPETKTP